jgi:hypothetical protein
MPTSFTFGLLALGTSWSSIAASLSGGGLSTNLALQRYRAKVLNALMLTLVRPPVLSGVALANTGWKLRLLKAKSLSFLIMIAQLLSIMKATCLPSDLIKVQRRPLRVNMRRTPREYLFLYASIERPSKGLVAISLMVSRPLLNERGWDAIKPMRSCGPRG